MVGAVTSGAWPIASATRRRLGGRWKIAWRTFDSIKQDREYASELEARRAAADLARSTVHASACDEDQIREYSLFWIEADGQPASAHDRFYFIEQP